MRYLGAAAAAAALLAALAACGQQQAPGHPGSSSLTRATRRDVPSGVVQLTGRRSGVVGLFLPNPPARPGRSVQLAATSNDGRSFRLIGPPQSNLDVPDSVFFLTRRLGWLASFDTLSTNEVLYRTGNGGRTWQAFRAPGHVVAAGSQDAVYFISRRVGWLTDTQPTGPIEALLGTSDGGRRWRCLAAAPVRRRGCAGRLPELGNVEFAANGRTGWLGGGMFSRALYRTRDGGRTWRKMPLAIPDGAVATLPAVFGRTIVEPVEVPADSELAIVVYLSTDDGAHWRLGGKFFSKQHGPSCAGPVSFSFPSRQVGWTTLVVHGRAVVYRSTDGGLAWHRTARAGRVQPGSSCSSPRILAASAADAWLVVPRADGDLIEATTDGGLAWRRISQAAAAATGR